MRRSLAALLSLALAVAPTPAVAAAAPPPASQAGPNSQRITLITGDVVTVAGGRDGLRLLAFEPGSGREGIGYRVTKGRDGALSVVPGDALDLLANGRLDPRLFDLDRLIDDHYSDDKSKALAVLVQGPKGRSTAGAQQVMKDARLRKSLPRLAMSSFAVDKTKTTAQWKALVGGERSPRAFVGEVGKLWLDGRVKATLTESVPQIGAPQVWQSGHTGEGVKVAVLDTGYDTDHPDLAGKVIDSQDFTGQGVEDVAGHGTHVAATIAGTGATTSGAGKGVAPGADLVVGKVLGNDGSGVESDIIAGMEWATTTAGAKVVNMSLGGPDTAGVDPMEQAVNDLSAQTGALFVISAGNEGPRSQTIGSPGSADAAVTVGAVDKQNVLAEFSSSGPRVGDLAVKPDITAPGVDIVAAKAGGGLRSASGTSMAAPHVAGAAALLAELHPDWPATRLKAALTSSAVPTPGLTAFQQGTGRVDVNAAATATVIAEGAPVFGPVSSTVNAPVTRTVSYRNLGSTPVTLTLEVSAAGAPAGLFTVSATSVTVPASGTADVTVTVDGHGRPVGSYSGQLTATTGSEVIRTAIGAYVQPEQHTLNLVVKDRLGAPANTTVWVFSRQSDTETPVAIANGSGTIDLPAGSYYLGALIKTDDTWTMAVVPANMSQDRTIILDSQQAKKATVTVGEPTARQILRETYVNFHYGVEDGLYTGFSMADYVLPVSDQGITYTAIAYFDKEGSSATSPSPYFYRIVDQRSGVPSEPTFQGTPANLTKVDVTYRGTASYASLLVQPEFDTGLSSPAALIYSPVKMPSVVTEYRTPGRWRGLLRFDGKQVLSDPREFGSGLDNTETWNGAVIGPALPAKNGYWSGTAWRDNNEMVFNYIKLHSDSEAGHGGENADTEGSMRLFRDDQQIWSNFVKPRTWLVPVTVPEAPSQYKLTASATNRNGATSTQIDTEWTFTSDATANGPLPLMVVRYRPDGLDELNRAAAGTVTPVVTSVQREPGQAVTSLASCLIESSVDDGSTWTTVAQGSTCGTPQITNPAAPGFVSLRATLADQADNTAKQTIIRAYQVKEAPGSTRIRVQKDAGAGNRITIRGNVSPLTWSAGRDCVKVSTAVWDCWVPGIPAGQAFEYKPLINDSVWSIGSNYHGVGGTTQEITPTF
ncbi:S8 family serine peptidase [Nonomuraea wenchangensis]